LAIKRRMSDGWVFESDTMYDNFNVYEDKKLFKINPNWNSIGKLKFIGKRETPLLIMDDALENVDEVRELALSAPYSNAKIKMSASPGIRCVFKIDWKIAPIARTFFKYWFEDKLNVKYPIPDPPISIFTAIDTKEAMSPLQCYPHIDIDWARGQRLGEEGRKHPFVQAHHIAALIYLNKNEECIGGTGIYRHKKLNTHLITNEEEHKKYKSIQDELDKGTRLRSGKFLERGVRDTNINMEKNKYYELTEVVEMKYNRLIMYPTCLFHHPIYSPDNFVTPNSRITLTSFM